MKGQDRKSEQGLCKAREINYIVGFPCRVMTLGPEGKQVCSEQQRL